MRTPQTQTPAKQATTEAKRQHGAETGGGDSAQTGYDKHNTKWSAHNLGHKKQASKNISLRQTTIPTRIENVHKKQDVKAQNVMAIDKQIHMGNTSQTTQRKATTKNNDNQRKHSNQHGEKAANKQTKRQGTNLTDDMQTDESRTAEP